MSPHHATLTPLVLKTLQGGWRAGTKCRNSSLPLYSLMEYRDSASSSLKEQESVTVDSAASQSQVLVGITQSLRPGMFLLYWRHYSQQCVGHFYQNPGENGKKGKNVQNADRSTCKTRRRDQQKCLCFRQTLGVQKGDYLRGGKCSGLKYCGLVENY